MDLGAATRGGLRRGEETITEDLLLNVKKAHPSEVIEYQFNKREKSFTGADWEWWLTDGRLWFGLLIQAKRLDLFADGAYDRLQLMDKAAYLDFVIEVIRRCDDQKDFQVLPRRWVVERTFAPSVG